jgi:integrase
MSRGNITRRGKNSWRLKFEAGDRDPVSGKRRTRYVTVQGTKKDAQAELTRLLAAVDSGTAVDPSKVTVAEYIRGWLNDAHGLSGKTVERYRELAARQIIPHLGTTPLQKLRPAQVQNWHAMLLRAGGADGKPLSARTVAHCHRLLHTALARAMNGELVSRNVAAIVRPPTVTAHEVQILAAPQITEVFARLEGHALLPIVTVALGTGMRRGELCALRWGSIDLDAGAIRVERSIEETRAGLREKSPKSRHGRRTIAVSASVIDALRTHRLRQTELRLAMGAGRIEPDDLVFTMPDGCALSPDNLSRDWRRTVLALRLPRVAFHALRHSHASALIAAGVDVLTISRRLGHATPAFTLTVYGHLFGDTDRAAAQAIETALRGG